MSNLSTDHQLGEGFAYFRWHSIRWPTTPDGGGCTQERESRPGVSGFGNHWRFICARMWAENDHG